MPTAVANFLVQGKRLMAINQGLLIASQLREIPADAVHGVGLAGPVICRAVQFECSAGVVKRMMVSALANAQSAVIKVSMRLPDIIVKFVIEVKRAL